MNEAIHCLKCKKKYYDHDIRICPNPHWEDIQEEPTLEFSTEQPKLELVMGEVTPEHPHRLKFFKDDKEVGYLDLDKGADFHGDATESAKVFFEILKQLLDRQIQIK